MRKKLRAGFVVVWVSESNDFLFEQEARQIMHQELHMKREIVRDPGVHAKKFRELCTTTNFVAFFIITSNLGMRTAVRFFDKMLPIKIYLQL